VLKPVSIPTEDGLFGLEPGAAVTKLASGKYMAQGKEVELAPNQVTNEIRVAELAFAADQAAQARMRSVLAAAPKPAPVPVKEVLPPVVVSTTPNTAQPKPAAPGSSDVAIPIVREKAVAAPAAQASAAKPVTAALSGGQLPEEGVYYLLQPASVITKDGVVGLSRGTQVRQLEEGLYLAEGQQVQLSSSQLTSDPSLADRLRQNDAADQARIRQTLGAASDASASTSNPTPATASNPPPSAPARSTLGGASSLQGSTLQRSGGLGQKR
jgi:hypothetical protein